MSILMARRVQDCLIISLKVDTAVSSSGIQYLIEYGLNCRDCL